MKWGAWQWVWPTVAGGNGGKCRLVRLEIGGEEERGRGWGL